MSEVGGRMLCARVTCGMPKLHDAHVGIYRTCPGFIKPARKVRREQMAAHSPKQQDYYDSVRIPDVEAIQGKPCEARVSDFIELPVSQRCTGSAVDIHEIVRRSQAGSLQVAVELGVMAVCRRCHNFITTHPREARDLGYSLSRKDIGL